jgi:hypothetical protein
MRIYEQEDDKEQEEIRSRRHSTTPMSKQFLEIMAAHISRMLPYN